MSRLLLRATGLGKSWPADSTPAGRLKALLRILAGRPVPSRPVLSDIGLSVHAGQSLGIIGENGAGKSTLLKLLTGVLHPTTGTVERQGRIGALLELGAGFDPEQTGRSNIATAAALMGMREDEIRAAQERIIEFADIGRYIDEPVKHYSSGMVVRLGFGVIAAGRPDLLITDEVLAVGDESFQKKCTRWIEDYLDDGGTLLLVSHSMYHVQKLCTQALWLRDGGVAAYGDVFDVTQDYLAWHERRLADTRGPALDPAYAGELYRIVEVRVNGDLSEAPPVLGDDRRLRIEVRLYSPDGRMPQFALGVVRADGTPVYGSSSDLDAVQGQAVDAHHWRYACEFDVGLLLPGGYGLRLHAMDPEGLRLFDTVERGFSIRGATREAGMVRLPHRWIES